MNLKYFVCKEYFEFTSPSRIGLNEWEIFDRLSEDTDRYVTEVGVFDSLADAHDCQNFQSVYTKDFWKNGRHYLYGELVYVEARYYDGDDEAEFGFDGVYEVKADPYFPPIDEED